MNDWSWSECREAFDVLERRLAGPLTPSEREEVKTGIIALFHQTEARLQDLTTFKESIRDLIAQYKALPTPEPTRTGERPVGPATGSVRHDHVGASTYIERGWSAIASRRWPDAEAHLRRALTLDGTSTTAQALLGWVHMAQGNPGEGAQCCRAVLAEVPDHGMARAVLGAICIQQGESAAGMALLEQVVAHPGEPRAMLYAHYWLGSTQLAQGAVVEAERALRQAVTLGPNLAEGWLALGHACWQQGRSGDAGEAWLRGSRIRHSAVAAACHQALDVMAAGGDPLRTPLW